MLYHFHVQTEFLPFLRKGKIWRPRGSFGRRQIKIVSVEGIQVVFRNANGIQRTMPAAVFMHHYRPKAKMSTTRAMSASSL
jgi:hypothetical protein